MIRPASRDDIAAVCAIYNHYVASTVVTFEEEPILEAEMARRIADVTAAFPWLVHETNGSVDGYAYASLWKQRSAYRFSVESTIYLRHDARGRGIGMQLYATLLEELRKREVHAVVGAIALPNAASVALHEKLGFERIGEFREVGWKLGRWVDVGYWQLTFDTERGSGR